MSYSFMKKGQLFLGLKGHTLEVASVKLIFM